MKNDRAVATVGALKVVESMGMADLVDNPDVFTTLEKSTTGMVERVSFLPAHILTVKDADSNRSTPRPERRPRASSCPLTARFCHGSLDTRSLLISPRYKPVTVIEYQSVGEITLLVSRTHYISSGNLFIC